MLALSPACGCLSLQACYVGVLIICSVCCGGMYTGKLIKYCRNERRNLCNDRVIEKRPGLAAAWGNFFGFYCHLGSCEFPPQKVLPLVSLSIWPSVVNWKSAHYQGIASRQRVI